MQNGGIIVNEKKEGKFVAENDGAAALGGYGRRDGAGDSPGKRAGAGK